MPNYILITTLCIVTVFMIIYEIYLFNEGKYYPYLTRNKEDSFKKIIIQTGLVIIIFICLYNLSTNNATPLAVLAIISLVFCESILNYLSYRKIKDRKIIYQTVIFDISLIALFALLFIMRIISKKG